MRKVIEVETGKLVGETSADATSFKGIPYARPPLGEYRWRAPQPCAAWSGQLDATRFGPACHQMAVPKRLVIGPDLGPQSEDCLYLNIWAPAHGDGKSPVMVWIHGGGFVWGSASDPFYDGAAFARRGIVLVSINYRLARFGFFAHPAILTTSPDGQIANFGLLDQIAALKWVRRNIHAFGGDPSNVTIFGESAGGAFVNLLMTAPVAAGLFEKAISMSGFARSPLRRVGGDGQGTAQAASQRFAVAQGIEGADDEAAASLRALPAAQIVSSFGGLSDPDRPGVCIDGITVRESPFSAFAAGRQMKVPYIAGGTDWEAIILPEVRARPDELLKLFESDRSKVARAYGNISSSDADVAERLATDVRVTEPNRALARFHARTGEAVFLYYFSYVPPSLRGSVPGAAHASELPYLFNTLPGPSEEDRHLSDAMISYWTSFAKESRPGIANGVHWPEFLPSETVMEFGGAEAFAHERFLVDRLDLIESVEP
ncbi:carboxylesterase family protein [Bradyrhizobium sp. BR13661]|jgi:para-nitrobenzyl esterase|uniref:carboxylesterase/lipase family protein n=1 Tax=Bradyrhizobium sp. BR13661 TaxID=2940622 RepID=UPI00247308E9|nr:carboxylesterase family protein [Bradyrhizobium sp. BR13661]MDH6260542.1 para-nitrobenzyl esterase [Bradyrhizobium sp. BR13661]